MASNEVERCPPSFRYSSRFVPCNLLGPGLSPHSYCPVRAKWTVTTTGQPRTGTTTVKYDAMHSRQFVSFGCPLSSRFCRATARTDRRRPHSHRKSCKSCKRPGLEVEGSGRGRRSMREGSTRQQHCHSIRPPICHRPFSLRLSATLCSPAGQPPAQTDSPLTCRSYTYTCTACLWLLALLKNGRLHLQRLHIRPPVYGPEMSNVWRSPRDEGTDARVCQDGQNRGRRVDEAEAERSRQAGRKILVKVSSR